MGDDLVKQPALRKWQESVYGKGPYQVPDYESMAAIVQEHEQMADRIEALEGGLHKMALEYLDAASKSYRAQLAAEAKLAKCEALMHAGLAEYQRRLVMALEALNTLADCVDDGCHCSEMRMATAMDHARTVLEELKGERDE